MLRSPGAKAGLVIAGIIFYVSIFLPFHGVLGDGISALSILPVALAAWFFGARLGLLVTLFAAIATIRLLSFDGTTDLAMIFQRGGGVGFATLIITSITVSRMSTLHRQLQRELVIRKQTEVALRESMEKLEALEQIIHTSPAVAFLWHASPIWSVEYVSENVDQFGYTAQELISGLVSLFDMVHPQDQRRIKAQAKRYLRNNRRQFALEFRITTRAGKVRWVDVRIRVRCDANGIVTHYEGVVVDSTERKNVEQALRESEARYRSVVASLAEGIILHDADGVIHTCNASAERILGLAAEQMTGQASHDARWTAIYENGTPIPYKGLPSMISVQTGQPVSNQIIGILKSEGTLIWVSMNTQPMIRRGETKPYAVVASFSDVTEQVQKEERLRYTSTHDILTGLYNRSFFEEELARLGRGRGFPISVIMIDVDNLKTTNDTLGHAGGDELLRYVARLLNECFRSEDVVARIGGDEFAILLPDTDARSANAAITRVRSYVAQWNQKKKGLAIGLSLGVSTALSGDALTEILKQADALMYDDKQSHSDDK